jgi:hypothetical protein
MKQKNVRKDKPPEMPDPDKIPEVKPLFAPENPVIPAEEPEIHPDKEPEIPKEIPPSNPESHIT